MYPEYNQVHEFIKTASLLMKTNKTMQDIFTLFVRKMRKRLQLNITT